MFSHKYNQYKNDIIIPKSKNDNNKNHLPINIYNNSTPKINPKKNDYEDKRKIVLDDNNIKIQVDKSNKLKNNSLNIN